MTPTPTASNQEQVKRESDFLRGDIARELNDLSTPGVSEETRELLKFHGVYFGINRDTADARLRQGQEPDYEFTVRLKCPGGRLSATQYLALDELCERHADGTLRLTARQSLQFHGVKKSCVKPLIADINHLLLSTLGACGDVVHNIMASPAPILDAVHAKLEEDCFLLARHCTPKTEAYQELWLDGERIDEYPFNGEPAGEHNPEPLYGKTYMPHKCKIGIATPDDNCIDVWAQDLAIISLFDGQRHIGYNFALGGGMAHDPANPKTYPFLAEPIMFVPAGLLLPATEAVIKLFRDHGDRRERALAPLKYLVVEKGAAWIKHTLESYLLQPMEAPRPMPVFTVRDHLGWHEQGEGKWYFGLPVPGGRIMDRDDGALRSALREAVGQYGGEVRLGADQKIILCNIDEAQKLAVEYTLDRFSVKLREDLSRSARQLMSCVALPSCGKALAEAERIESPLMGDIEQVMEKSGVLEEEITIRIAGCAQGCSRPFLAEIGIVGCAPGAYAIYVGGNREGTRLNQKIFEPVPLENVAQALGPLFELWRVHGAADERFGDFCARAGIGPLRAAALGLHQDRAGAR